MKMKEKKKRILTTVIMSAVLSVLAIGCGKENSEVRLQIFEESMVGSNDAKVLVDFSNLTNNTWVVDEGIFVTENDGGYTTKKIEEKNGNYYIDYGTEHNAINAVYPSNLKYVDAYRDDYITINGQTTAVSEDITLYGTNVGVKFPMVAHGDVNSQSLMFKHTSGAVTFKIKNSTGSNVTLNKIQDYAHSLDGNNQSISYYWNRVYYYFKEDNFSIQSNYSPKSSNYVIKNGSGSDGYILADGESVNMVLPIPVMNGFQLRIDLNTSAGTKTFKFNMTAGVSRNKMYKLPDMVITNE